jgi:proteic killer suppression protein
LGNTEPAVIEDFACKETSKIFQGITSRRFPAGIQARALMKLRQIHRATSIDQLSQPPSNRLEPLVGKLKGYWSIRINQQWRIVFRWEDGAGHNVRIIDYH